MDERDGCITENTRAIVPLFYPHVDALCWEICTGASRRRRALRAVRTSALLYLLGERGNGKEEVRARA